MNRPHRTQPMFLAFLLHRVSGILLALFLPFHFWVLSLALTSPDVLDGFLGWTELGLVKFAEFGLVFLLAVHMFGGLRLMVFEWRPWTSGQKSLAAGAISLAFLIAVVFLLRAL